MILASHERLEKLLGEITSLEAQPHLTVKQRLEVMEKSLEMTLIMLRELIDNQ